METIFILQNDAKYPWFRYRNIDDSKKENLSFALHNLQCGSLQTATQKFNSNEMLNSCNLIAMNELYPENGITRFLNILIQKQQGMKNSRWSKCDKIFSYFLFPLSL